MLEGRQALDLALELARMPTLADAMRASPLPPDVQVVIRIAAGCPETCREAVRATRIRSEAIQEAALLYVQEILFAPSADGYRVLGVQPAASRAQMRENMRWFLTWLHPDGNQSDWESVFAERVIKAWRQVGSKKDSDRGISERSEALTSYTQSIRLQTPTQRWVALPLNSPVTLASRWRRASAVALIGMLVVGLTMVIAVYADLH